MANDPFFGNGPDQLPLGNHPNFPALFAADGKSKRRRLSYTTLESGFNTTRPSLAMTHLTASGLRQAHFLSLLPTSTVSSQGQRTLVDYRVYREASSFLAFLQLQQLNSNKSGNLSSYNNQSNTTGFSGGQPVLPEIMERLKNCDIQFSLEMRDTEFSPLYAARQLLIALSRESTDNNNSNNISELVNNIFGAEQDIQEHFPPPLAVLGAARSAVSAVVSYLAGSYGVPLISPSSTASVLDNKDAHPLFARTVPSNAGDARALAIYFQQEQIFYMAILYFGDDYGTNFHAELAQEAAARGIQVYSVQYNDDGTQQDSMAQLAASGMRYIVGILGSSSWTDTVILARQNQIMGVDGYTWFLTDSTSQLVDDTFSVSRPSQTDLAQALNGVGIVMVHVDPYPPFDAALLDFSKNRTLQQEYIQLHGEPEVLANFTFEKPGWDYYQYLSFDAMMALGIAACEAPQNIVTGTDLYAQLVKTEFHGISGRVSFDPDTGTRQSSNFAYSIQNIFLSNDRSDNTSYRFSVQMAALVNQSDTMDPVKRLNAFVYSNNLTNAPPALPPVSENMNLIPSGIRILAWSLCGLVMLNSVGWLAWTISYRTKDVVRASQPIFLGMLSVGTLIMACAIIPLSLQEPVSLRKLDVACMSIPWLVSIGFVTAFSALFSKTWRLNKLIRSSQTMKRVTVSAKDVIYPFVILLTLNIALLISWTVVSPLVWKRDPVANYDKYGRSVESVGGCGAEDGKGLAGFLVPILVVDVAALVKANYQAYRARNLPTEFSEATYVACATASLLETFVIGFPLLFFASGNPTTSFLIRSLLICVLCLTIQLPVFLPKYLLRHQKLRQQGRSGARARSSVHVSHGVGSRSEASTRKSFTMSNSLPGVYHGEAFVQEDQSEPLRPGATRVRRADQTPTYHRSSLPTLRFAS